MAPPRGLICNRLAARGASLLDSHRPLSHASHSRRSGCATLSFLSPSRSAGDISAQHSSDNPLRKKRRFLSSLRPRPLPLPAIAVRIALQPHRALRLHHLPHLTCSDRACHKSLTTPGPRNFPAIWAAAAAIHLRHRKNPIALIRLHVHTPPSHRSVCRSAYPTTAIHSVARAGSADGRGESNDVIGTNSQLIHGTSPLSV